MTEDESYLRDILDRIQRNTSPKTDPAIAQNTAPKAEMRSPAKELLQPILP
ncbi:MAG: hypothetical protein AB4352_05845 [Hormoscilla sp.]